VARQTHAEAEPVPTRPRCLWCGVPIKMRSDPRGPGTEVVNHCAKCVSKVRAYDSWLSGGSEGKAPECPLEGAERAAVLVKEITDAARTLARERGEVRKGEPVTIRRKPKG
jgi:hypothetical protein